MISLFALFPKELQNENNFRQAEHHYIQAKDWKAAVNMYRSNEMWDEAFRVGRSDVSPFEQWSFEATEFLDNL